MHLRPTRRFLLLALPAFLGACADTSRDPVAMLVTPEARAALEVGVSLPRLPELVRRSVPGGEPMGALARADSLWSDAAGMEGARAAELRDSAYALAVPVLAAGMEEATLAGAQARLEEWTKLASGVLHGSMPELEQALADARGLLREARAAEAHGDRTSAVLLTLRASDRLAETTPKAVALRLSAAADSALTALRRDGPEPVGEDGRRRMERIERLVRGAREAVRAGDFEMAIRRGFYARQLLSAERRRAGGGGP